MTEDETSLALEAILFYKSQPVSKKELSNLLNLPPEALTKAVTKLQNRLTTGAITLIETDTELTLATKPAFDALLTKLQATESQRSIGVAGAETLAIVLYRGPVSKALIERIRGVNSTYVLRALLLRGLIKKTTIARRTEYRVTSDTLAHLGISRKTELPNYKAVCKQLASFADSNNEIST